MDRIFADRIRELSDRAERTGTAVFSHFLTPEETAELNRQRNSLCPFTLFGGAEGCERTVARFAEYPSDEPFPISVVFIRPKNEKFAGKISHRDVLGAVMSLGIEREYIGDIFVRDSKAYMFVFGRMAEYVVAELKEIGRTSVVCSAEDEIPAGLSPVFTDMRIVVSSARADCVAAAVFGLSRKSVSDLFAAKKVFVNSALCGNISYVLSEGDTVSVRGFGKFIFDGISGETKKGRLAARVRIYG